MPTSYWAAVGMAAPERSTTLFDFSAIDALSEEQEHHTARRGLADTAAATNLLDPVGSDPASVLVGIRNAEVLIAGLSVSGT